MQRISEAAVSEAGTAAPSRRTPFGVAGVLSPFVFGLLLQISGSWQVPFITSVVLLFIGVLLALRIDPTRTFA